MSGRLLRSRRRASQPGYFNINKCFPWYAVLPTSAILLIFSLRSFSENPKSLFSPNRTLSPSRRYAATPRCRRCCSRAVATVDFPEADRPVSQSVNPRCFLNPLRSCREREGCQVMFLYFLLVFPLLTAGFGGVLASPFCLVLGNDLEKRNLISVLMLV